VTRADDFCAIRLIDTLCTLYRVWQAIEKAK
jgi:hypothetical protein